MDERYTAWRGLAAIMGLGLLFGLWGLQLIGSSPLLAGLGLLALLGYYADRSAQEILLAPGGLMLSLGLGLTLTDATDGTPLAWLGAATIFGLGLTAIYVVERRHTWALGFGALLVICGVGASVWLVAGPIWIIGTPLALGVAAAGSSLTRRRRQQELTYQS